MKRKWLEKGLDRLLGREQLDEMKRQEMNQIHADGYWLAFWGLFAVMMVQVGMGAGMRQYGGELIVFMLLAAVTLVRELYHGLWDARFKPNLKTNLLLALASGAGVAVFNFATWRYPEFEGLRLLSAGIAGGFTFVLTLALLTVCCAFYKRRHRELESGEPDEDPQEE